MEKKLKIGVFGGARGHAMIDVLFEHPHAELVAVCDKYQPLLDRVAEEAKTRDLSIELYNNFEDFLDCDMDAVVLANYANEHAPFAVRCLKVGKHVLSEVLPCETMAQAVKLIETVEQTGLVYAYAENYCYMQHAFEMWRRYEAGEIGEVEYCVGEYIHDCSRCWPQITYGEREHWRNRMYATFYCTHSIGPLLTVTGRRPVQVIGFELPPKKPLARLGNFRGAGIEILTLDNGAVARSIHGPLKREPSLVNYQFYGTKGMMESGRFEENKPMNLYKESDRLCIGEWEKYTPEIVVEKELASKFSGHNGSDFYPTHFFIEKILGNPVAKKYSIDVYTAVDMGICGILAYRSALNGNAPIQVPDLRDPAQRDAWRDDHACTTPAVAGDALLPVSSYPIPEIPDRVYDYVCNLWKNGKEADFPCPDWDF